MDDSAQQKDDEDDLCKEIIEARGSSIYDKSFQDSGAAG